MKRQVIISLTALAITLALSSWGYVGHSIISFKTQLSFNEEMSMFDNWIIFLTDHASDADKRKYDQSRPDYDPDEGPRHYIDIDAYSGFNEEGRIPHTIDSCFLEYGSGFVGDNGTLPWATLASYDSLVACLKREDLDKAKIFGADLGHYVADGHMPMHLTLNYDGQLSGNKGIHSRYESDMVGRYDDEIIYDGHEVEAVENVRDYIFEYIYENYVYMDSILQADDKAADIAGDKSSSTYYSELWKETKNMTIAMFENASHAFSELLYTAMLEAEDHTAVAKKKVSEDKELISIQVYPNPLSEQSSIEIHNPAHLHLNGAIYDTKGALVQTLEMSETPSEHQSILWNAAELKPGVYFIHLSTPTFSDFHRVVVQNW